MKRKSYSRRKRTTTKSVLRLPDLERAKAAVLNSSPAWTPSGVIVTPSMNWLTGILRNLAWLSTELQCCAIGLISNPSTCTWHRQSTSRCRAPACIRGRRLRSPLKKLGVRVGHWLTTEQGQALWQTPDHQRLKGKHGRALLALLLDLRRCAWLCHGLGRRVGADPIPPGPCLSSNDRTIRVNDHIGIEPNP
jgi:hypothetical protein